MENTHKTCTVCQQEKALSLFPLNYKGKFGRGQKCLTCSSAYAAQYRKHNYHKIYAKKFNTSEEVVEALLTKQECEICGASYDTFRRHAIDHNHVTGKVRGLLCHDCNTGLGKFKDDIMVLQKATAYLEKYA